MYQNKYSYENKLEFNNSRFYKVNEYTKSGINWLYFPSVTTITSLIPNPKLEEFMLSVGLDESKIIAERAANRGTAMHLLLEEFILEYNRTHNKAKALQHTQEVTPLKFKELGLSHEAISKGRKLFYKFYESPRFLEDFKFLSGTEEVLFSLNHRYAGTADCIYFADNNIVIRDYKSSSREKTSDEILSYFIQISAYMKAYEEMYDLEIELGQIMICNEKTGLQIFEVRRDEIDIYFNQFLELLENFNKTINYEEIYEFAISK